jgi:hypothetical protein
MEHKQLISEHIAAGTAAKILVIFGGNVIRRDEIVRLLMPIDGLTIYATLSEEEGMEKMKRLEKVDVVLIGGRYTPEQRKNIKNYAGLQHPNAIITEPGVDYEYSNQSIFEHVRTATQ